MTVQNNCCGAIVLALTERIAKLENEIERMRRQPGPFDMPIGDLDLSARADNVLAAKGVKLVGDLVVLSEYDLRKSKNCGPHTVTEIKAALAGHGLELRKGRSGWVRP